MVTAPVIYIENEAVRQFELCLQAWSQEDATGGIYCVYVNADGDLAMMPYTGRDPNGEEIVPMPGIQSFNCFEMVILECANSIGQGWKATLYPKQRTMSFVNDNF